MEMGSTNPLNVYSGPDALLKYYDPDSQPPIPLVEIPQKLNPFYDDGVRIYAKMMSTLPANNVKSLPALNMLKSPAVTAKTNRIIEYSSGSTVVSLSILARILHDIDDVHAYLSNKTSDAKLRMMRFFGLSITLFGGPSQPSPYDRRGGIQRAREEAESSESVYNPNQYENEDNYRAHIRWTGPQIVKQLPDINVLAAGLGTSGTMTGIGSYIKEVKPSCHNLGVCTAPGDRVPGPRSYALLSPVKFPWRDAIDSVEEVGSPDSYRLSMLLSREGLICGPSSGFNLQGLFNFLQRRKKEGTLSKLSSDNGEIKCVFICCDLPYQYLNEYFEKLDESHFHPINNAALTSVDLYRYDEAWELQPDDALNKLYGGWKGNGAEYGSDTSSGSDSGVSDVSLGMHLRKTTILLDLRSGEAFETWHLPGSINLPLECNSTEARNPFFDAGTLRNVWLDLESVFSKSPYAAALVAGLTDREVGVVCKDGNIARVATSVLRAKGVQAFSVAGGTEFLAPLLRNQC